MKPLLSVVVPCYDEQESLPNFYNAITQVAAQMDQQAAFEFLFIDDGSRDDTLRLLHELSRQDARVRFISFTRNFGKEAGMIAGLDAARGDYVVIMDADLQHPPELLPSMFEAVTTEGYDCAATYRATRDGEGKVRSFLSRSFYKIISRISETPIQNSCDYRMMTRPMVDAILRVRESNRFSKGIFSWVGFQTKWIPFENVERVAGTTKWSFWKLLRYSFSGIESFSAAPLAIASVLGVLVFLCAIVYAIVIIVRTIAYGDPVSGWPSLMCIILILSGFQLLCIGILGRYVSNIFLEVKRRPLYLVRETEETMPRDEAPDSKAE